MNNAELINFLAEALEQEKILHTKVGNSIMVTYVIDGHVMNIGLSVGQLEIYNGDGKTVGFVPEINMVSPVYIKIPQEKIILAMATTDILNKEYKDTPIKFHLLNSDNSNGSQLAAKMSFDFRPQYTKDDFIKVLYFYIKYVDNAYYGALKMIGQ